MKVWKILSPKVLTVEERPDAISTATQAKVKITKVLISYPEIREYSGAAGNRHPRVPGMFAVGVVAETGEGCVKVEKNTRVYINGMRPCGECAECRKGNEELCLSPKIAGLNTDGFLRDFAVVEEEDLCPLPPSVSDNQALYAGIISMCESVVNKLAVPKGTHIAVIGAGETGNILSQLLIYHQAVPVLIDSDESKLAVAAKCGIYYTLKADDTLIKNLSEITGGRMAEGCVYTSFCALAPDLPFELTAVRGKVIYAGLEFPEIGVKLKAALEKKLTVTGTTDDFAQSYAAINLLVNKAVDFTPFQVEERNISEISDIFAEKNQMLEKEKRVIPAILNML